MTNPLKTDASASLGLLAARVPLGAFFLIAGYRKVFNMGVEKFATTFKDKVPPSVPHDFGNFYLHALPYAEVLVGALVVVGLFTRLVGLTTALMLISFIIAITGITDPSTTNPMPFQPNLIYLGVALLLFFVGAGRFSVDRVLFGRKNKKSAAPVQ